MAISPEISLQVKPPEPVDWSRYAQLANLVTQNRLTQAQIENTQAQLPQIQAQTANLEAQRPGIEADSAIKQRAASFQKWQKNNVDKFMNPDGTPNITGFVNAASKDGFYTEAQAVAASDLANKGQAIANASNAQDSAAKRIQYANDALGYTATLLSNAPAAERDQLLKNKVQYLESQVPGVGNYVAQMLTSPGKTTDSPVLDEKKLLAAKEATMTPLESRNIAVAEKNAATSNESVVQAGIQGLSGPEARNPNSPMSRQARALAQQLGIPGVSKTMSAAEIGNLPGAADLMKNAVIPAAVKGTAITDAAQNQKLALEYGTISDLTSRLIDKKILRGDTNVSGWMSQNLQKFINDPDVRALSAALNNVQAVNPNFNLNIGASSLQAAARTQQGLAIQRSRVSNAVATNPTFRGAAEAGIEAGTAKNPGIDNSMSGKVVPLSVVQNTAKRTGKSVDAIIADIKAKGGEVK